MAQNVIDLLKSTGIEPRPAARGAKGVEYWSPCPGCGGDDRFHVWPDQNEGAGSWWCRGCNLGGDNIEFCRRFMGMDFRAACEHVGRGVPEYERRQFYDRPQRQASQKSWQPDAAGAPDGVDVERWRNKAAELVVKAHAALLENEKALAYLAGRGIDRAAVERFQLGWLAGEGKNTCLFRPRESWGLPTIKKANGRKKMLWIPRGLVIPCHGADGDVVRLRIRRPKADLQPDAGGKLPAKYFVVPGSTMARMLINPDAKAFVVVEAELDALAVDVAAGDLVGALAVGSSSTKPDAAVAGPLQKALAILVALDFDHAGAGAWPWWQGQFERARRWPVPAGKDPGDAVKERVDLRAWIIAGLPPALTIGPSRFGLDETKGGAENDVPSSGRRECDDVPDTDEQIQKSSPEQEMDADPAGGVDGLAPSVGELAALLKQYPVRIINRPERTAIEERSIMQRRFAAESKRISQLVYFDRACWDHIAAHPAEIVDGSNFFDSVSSN